MAKRIFVALPISASLEADILAWEEKYARLPVRWLDGKNLHVTLVPPWYEEDVESVVRKLGTVRQGKFGMSFETVSFGLPGSPRLIWAEGVAGPDMIKLKDNVLKMTVAKPENRPFRLHLTLARFRPEDFPRFPIKKINDRVDWQEEVSSFVLMESHLSREGADYEVLQKFELS